MWKCTLCDVLLWIVVAFSLLFQVDEVSTYEDPRGNPQLLREFWNPELSRLASRDLECSRPDLYVCEEPPEAVSASSTKLCNYRNVHYTEQIFRWVAGRGCLFYMPNFLFVNGTNPLNLNSACRHGTLLSYAPCLELSSLCELGGAGAASMKPDGTCGCFPFDPSFKEVSMAVEEALVPSARGRWERCYQAAAECCSNVMTDADVIAADGSCGATFDAWDCWESAPTNTTATQVCPEFAYTNTGPTCHHFSSKNCTETGMWDIQTEYGTCSITPRLIKRNRYYIWALAASIIICVPAICVFFFYKRLRVTRVALHRNLLIAIVIRNLLVIITRTEIYLDELINSSDTTMSAHDWPCRVLAILERIAVNMVFVCMLVEGIYLHRLICAVFRKKLNVKILYSVGALISVVPVACWATVMVLLDDHSCWIVYTVPHIQWTLDAPRITILLANTILFIDIIRVLLTKIKNSETANQLSTAKATLFLMPLFGVQFLLTAYRPSTTSCTLEQTYYIFTYTMEAMQGALVAILYCYANKEVHNLVRITYKKTETAVVSRVRPDSNYRRSTLGASSNRRETYSTAIDNQPQSPASNFQTREELQFPNVQKFATLLEPIEEAGIVNDGFDESEAGSDSGYSPPDNQDDTNSKTSTGRTDETIECQDWIKCISSPTSSIYDNDLNEYEIRYLEENAKKTAEDREKEKALEHGPRPTSSKINSKENTAAEVTSIGSESDISFSNFTIPDHSDIMDGSELFEQMLRSAVTRKESRGSVKDVVLDPNALSPNRPDGEKIKFVDE